MFNSPPLEGREQSLAVVTPTYLPDLRRCELLSESIDRCVPDIQHYLIVDRRDRSAFGHLKGRRRDLIDSEALVGHWMVRMPIRKSFWLSAKAPPVRGWIIQQILKIGAVDFVPERTLVFCDSDVAFFRRFDRSNLLVDGKMGLVDIDFVTDEKQRWTKVARSLLGLSPDDGEVRNHTGNMICWNRETVKAMQRQIENSTGVNWQVAIARTLNFSEYMTYGVFVREVLGYDAVDHAPSAVPLVKGMWNNGLATDSAIDEFFAAFDPQTVGIMIHSKDGVDPSRYRHHLQRLWDEELTKTSNKTKR